MFRFTFVVLCFKVRVHSLNSADLCYAYNNIDDLVWLPMHNLSNENERRDTTTSCIFAPLRELLWIPPLSPVPNHVSRERDTQDGGSCPLLPPVTRHQHKWLEDPKLPGGASVWACPQDSLIREEVSQGIYGHLRVFFVIFRVFWADLYLIFHSLGTCCGRRPKESTKSAQIPVQKHTTNSFQARSCSCFSRVNTKTTHNSFISFIVRNEPTKITIENHEWTNICTRWWMLWL